MGDSEYPGGVHPYADMFPLLVGEPFSSLVADIEEHGQRDPILITDGGVLIDGRNRWAACRDIGREAETETLPPMTEVELLDLIVSKNLRRRDLGISEKAFLGLEYKKRYDAAIGQGKRTDFGPTDLKLSREGRSARGKAAKAVGVGANTITRLERVVRDTPELAEKVKAGEMSINAADTERARRQAGGLEGDKVRPKLSNRPVKKQIMSLLAQLSATAHMSEIIPMDAWTAEDIKEFDHLVAEINSFRRKLKKESISE